MEKNNKKVVNAWCFYDWANSVYTLTITTAIFPIYFNAVTTQPDGNDMVSFLWMHKKNSVIFTYSLSIAFLVTSFLSPLLSGMADYGGVKKKFMQFFVYIGSFSCMALFFFDSGTVSLGILFFILASIGYAGSLVFYNAFLPEIATPDQFDSISAKGYSLGYIGSVLLLIVNLIIVQQPGWFGIENSTLPARISFLMVGLWWLGFSYYTFAHLPDQRYQKFQHGKYVMKGFTALKKVFSAVKGNVLLKTFLSGFFFYSMGFQTIMYLAGLFGSKELHLPDGELIAIVLIIQLVAIGGAVLFTRSASRIGNVTTLMLGAVCCIVICIFAYSIYSPVPFYILAVAVGIIMGGIQSLSRSTYSKLLPETSDHASYFSFYEFTEKVGIVIGTATFALINDLTGSMRNSIFALIVFFLIGLFFLIRIINSKKKYQPIPI